MTQVSEKKLIKYVTDCVDNPVYLRWLNHLGYYEYWTFSKRQEVEITGEELQTNRRLVSYLEDEKGYEFVRSKRMFKKMLVGASSLNTNEFEALSMIAGSNEVAIWYTEVDKFVDVIVDEGSNIRVTDEPANTVELYIIYPEMKTQTRS